MTKLSKVALLRRARTALLLMGVEALLLLTGVRFRGGIFSLFPLPSNTGVVVPLVRFGFGVGPGVCSCSISSG